MTARAGADILSKVRQPGDTCPPVRASPKAGEGRARITTAGATRVAWDCLRRSVTLAANADGIGQPDQRWNALLGTCCRTHQNRQQPDLLLDHRVRKIEVGCLDLWMRPNRDGGLGLAVNDR
jgi:hypothetical protein